MGVIDLRALRDDPDAYRDSQRKRGASADAVDSLLSTDAEEISIGRGAKPGMLMQSKL